LAVVEREAIQARVALDVGDASLARCAPAALLLG
jgi:hypothetical protein